MRKIKTKKRISILIIMLMVFSVVGVTSIVEADQGNDINLNLRGVDLRDAFRAIADIGGMNVITDGSVSGSVTINLREVSFLDAIELLAKTNGLDYKMVNNTILIGSQEGLEEGFGNRVTKVYPLEHAEPAEVMETLSLLIDAEGIRVDGRTKSIIVTTYDSRLAEVEHIINSLDMAKRQVNLQLRLFEVNHDLRDEIGVNWDDDGQIIGDSDDGTFGLSVGPMSIDGDGVTYDSIFDALETQNLGRTLANPKITTIDGEMAYIHVGDEVPIINSGPDGMQVEFKDVGVNLEVTPRLMEDGEVMINLRPEVSSITNWVTSGGYSLPQIGTRRAETNIRVKDGETFALGGLISEDEISIDKKIPLLGDIPLLGRLFRSTSKSASETELIIFVTPEIIDDVRISADELIEEDYLDQFSYRVRSHDTLWGIGELFGISYLDIMDYNNIEEVSALEVGRVLSLPIDSRRYYRVSEGDSLESVADNYNLARSDLIRMNNIVTLEGMAGEEIILPIVID